MGAVAFVIASATGVFSHHFEKRFSGLLRTSLGAGNIASRKLAPMPIGGSSNDRNDTIAYQDFGAGKHQIDCLPSKNRNMRATKPARVRMQPRRPRGRPKAEDVEALEARLVSVALQAFLLNGYGATSINSIAKSARVSKNTLYARFPSKAALFRVIVARQVAGVQEELRPASGEQAESLAHMLRSYVDVALRRSLSREVLEINRLIVSESYQFPELGEAAWARFQSGVERIARFIEVWSVRDRIPCRDATAAAEVFLYCVYGWYNSVMISNRTVTDRERASWIDRAIKLFLASRPTW